MTNILTLTVHTNTLFRIVLLGFVGFIVSMIITPLYTNLAYRRQWWKKPRETAVTGEVAVVFNQLHGEKHKRQIPTMAGMIFVAAVVVVTLVANLARTETWLPLAAFAGAAGVGLIDDIINIKGSGRGVAGLPSKLKLLLITLIALIGGLFFYYKLNVASIHIPLMYGQWHVGLWIIPIFVLVVVSTANAD